MVYSTRALMMPGSMAVADGCGRLIVIEGLQHRTRGGDRRFLPQPFDETFETARAPAGHPD